MGNGLPHSRNLKDKWCPLFVWYVENKVYEFYWIVVEVVVYLMSTLSPLQVEEIFWDSCFIALVVNLYLI